VICVFSLDQWLSTEGIFLSFKGHLALSRDFCIYHKLVEEKNAWSMGRLG
jgi:hypothetical protein